MHVNVHIWVCVCKCMCVSACRWVCMWVDAYEYVLSACMSSCTWAHMSACIWVWVSACICACECLHMRACINVCMWVCPCEGRLSVEGRRLHQVSFCFFFLSIFVLFFFFEIGSFTGMTLAKQSGLTVSGAGDLLSVLPQFWRTRAQHHIEPFYVGSGDWRATLPRPSKGRLQYLFSLLSVWQLASSCLDSTDLSRSLPTRTDLKCWVTGSLPICFRKPSPTSRA